MAWVCVGILAMIATAGFANALWSARFGNNAWGLSQIGFDDAVINLLLAVSVVVFCAIGAWEHFTVLR